MRTTRRVLTSLLPLAALPLAACGTAPGVAYKTVGPSAPASASGPVRGTGVSGTGAARMMPARTLLTVEKTPAGYVLATGAGRTVYLYGKDMPGSGKSACADGCLSAWPAVTGTPFVASGVRLVGVLGSITRPDGTVQATYNGCPLYTYAADAGPGQTDGDGEGGVWHVITGTALTASPDTAAADAAASRKAVAAVKAGGKGM